MSDQNTKLLLPKYLMRGVYSQDMIKDNHVFVAYTLSSLHKIAYRLGISTYFGLWENHAQLHRFAPLIAPAPSGPEWSLSFCRPCRQARNIVVEKDYVNKRDRYRPQQRSCHQPTPMIHVTPNEFPYYRGRNRLFVRISDEHNRVEILTPR